MAIEDLDSEDGHDYSLHTSDLAMTGVCKRGICALDDQVLLRAMLHLYGMDMSRNYYFEPLLDGASYISQISGDVVTGGDLIVGYERTDKGWKKYKVSNIQKYLFDDEGVELFLQTIEDAKLVKNVKDKQLEKGSRK